MACLDAWAEQLPLGVFIEFDLIGPPFSSGKPRTQQGLLEWFAARFAVTEEVRRVLASALCGNW